MTDFQKQFANKLKEIRIMAGLSQEQLLKSKRCLKWILNKTQRFGLHSGLRFFLAVGISTLFG